LGSVSALICTNAAISINRFSGNEGSDLVAQFRARIFYFDSLAIGLG
jgi:hypothetical protein